MFACLKSKYNFCLEVYSQSIAFEDNANDKWTSKQTQFFSVFFGLWFGSLLRRVLFIFRKSVSEREMPVSYRIPRNLL